MRCLDSYCHILTSGILVFFFCRLKNQRNISIMSGKLLLTEYFAVIFLKRNSNQTFMCIHLYSRYTSLNALIAWSPDLPLNAVIAIPKYWLKVYF